MTRCSKAGVESNGRMDGHAAYRITYPVIPVVGKNELRILHDIVNDKERQIERESSSADALWYMYTAR